RAAQSGLTTGPRASSARNSMRRDGRRHPEGRGDPVGGAPRLVAVRVRPDVHAVEAADVAYLGLDPRVRELRLHVREEVLRVAEILERAQLDDEAGGVPADRRGRRLGWP